MLLKHTIISRLCGCCMPLYLPISVSFCMRACERMWSCQVTYIHCSFPPFCLRPRAHHWLQGWCHRSDKGTSLLRHSHMHRQKHNHPEIHVSTWRHTWADWRHRACNVRDSVRILCSCGFHLLIPFVLLSVKEVSAVIADKVRLSNTWRQNPASYFDDLCSSSIRSLHFHCSVKIFITLQFPLSWCDLMFMTLTWVDLISTHASPSSAFISPLTSFLLLLVRPRYHLLPLTSF